MIVRIFLVILAVLGTSAASALDEAGLRQATADFMHSYSAKLLSRYGKDARLDYRVGTIAPGLALPDCAQPLHFDPHDQAQLTTHLNVQVSCAEGAPWSVYVGIDTSIYRQVVTTVKPLTRGSTISADDVALSEVDITHVSGQYLTEVAAAVGMDLKRTLAQGATVFNDQLDQPLLIHRGEAVLINAEAGSMTVKMSGTALGDGRRGQPIRVKNDGSAKVVDAKVIGPGQVSVAM